MHPESHNCVLCLHGNEETLDQLFLDCDFAKKNIFSSFFKKWRLILNFGIVHSKIAHEKSEIKDT